MADSACPSLQSLPDEIIVKIFEFCDIQSLGRLASTCKQFNRLVYTEGSCWLQSSRSVICSNMNSIQMQERSRPKLTFMKRCQVSKNWERGLSLTRIIVHYPRCMPWINLEENYLYCSKGRMILKFPREMNGNIVFNRLTRITPHDDDIAKFAVNENEVVTASRDGRIGRWKKKNLQCIHRFMSHASAIYSIDAKNDIIVSGSRDEFIKIWSALPRDTECRKEIDMKVRILSVAIMPSNRYFVAGLPGTRHIHPLQLFDLERSKLVTNLGRTFTEGAGILDIYPESDHTFLSCGYDTTVKLWDIRTPENCAASWMDPYDNSIYCVRSDHDITIVSGANRNGIIHIWDKRSSRCENVNLLFHIRNHNSPVYSLAFDATHLFVALDLEVLQFTYFSSIIPNSSTG